MNQDQVRRRIYILNERLFNMPSSSLDKTVKDPKVKAILEEITLLWSMLPG